VKQRTIAAVLSGAAALLAAPHAGAAQAAIRTSSSTPCPNRAQQATMTLDQGFAFDNPCPQWAMAIFLGAPPDAIFRIYAAPGAHVHLNAAQVAKLRIKDGFNGNPVTLKALQCSKQGRKELVIERSGKVHANQVCHK
jgi:hypothetical protein